MGLKVIVLMPKEVIVSEKTPKPVGPYSQAVKAGNFLFISGQLPINPTTGEIVRGNFEEAVKIVLENVKSIVEEAGGTMDDIVKVTVYMKGLNLFSKFNEIYSQYFRDKYPARVVVEVSKIPKDVDLEVEAIAYIGR